MTPFCLAQHIDFSVISCLNNTNACSNSYAVVVGLSDYRYVDVPEELAFAVDSAIMFSNEIKRLFNIRQENIFLFLNDKATAQNINQSLIDVISKSKPNDKIFVYFAAKIEQDWVTNSDYLLFYDIAPNSELFSNDAISLVDLNFLEKKAEEKNVELIINMTNCNR